MESKDLVGTYHVSGKNQDESATSYTGVLQLEQHQYGRLKARWNIGNDQSQKGIGFYKNGILVINFEYIGTHDKTFKGVVVYKCLSINVWEGFWSEEHGDPRYLGVEDCVRANQADLNLH